MYQTWLCRLLASYLMSGNHVSYVSNPHFCPFLRVSNASQQGTVHSDGFWEHFWETKSKQNDEIESIFVRWAEKEHGGEMSSSPCFFGLGYPVSNQN